MPQQNFFAAIYARATPPRMSPPNPSSSSPSSSSSSSSSSPSPPPKHSWITRIRVTGGYLHGIDVRFAPGGNVVFGNPGSGKSTLLTILRYVLCLPVPPVKKDEQEKVLGANLGSGRAFVTIASAYGAEYELSRAGGEAGPRVESAAGSMPSVKAILDMLPSTSPGTESSS